MADPIDALCAMGFPLSAAKEAVAAFGTSEPMDTLVEYLLARGQGPPATESAAAAGGGAAASDDDWVRVSTRDAASMGDVPPPADDDGWRFGDLDVWHSAAFAERASAFVDVLRRHAAGDVDCTDAQGMSPLHYAALHGNIDVVLWLLTHGASTNLQCANGNTPLLYALKGRIDSGRADSHEPYDRIVTEIVAYGADINRINGDGVSPLHVAVAWPSLADQQDIPELLAGSGAIVECRDHHGDTPLHQAAALGSNTAALLLLNHGAAVDPRNVDDDTPLHLAAANGTGRVMSVLIQRGARVNLANKSLETPLHLASRNGHNKAVRRLLNAKADHMAKNAEGKTPYQIAFEARNLEAIDLFVESLQQGDYQQQQQHPRNRNPHQPRRPAGQSQQRPAPAPAGDKEVAALQEHLHSLRIKNQRAPDPAARRHDNSCDINFDELQLGPLIGSGEFGEVFKGVFAGTLVACKKLKIRNDASVIDDFKREAAILSRVRHPNIVQYMGSSFRHPDYFLVTEFCENGNLYDLLRERSVQGDHLLRLNLAKGVAKGMQYLHEMSPPIMHRDLKSLNVLIDSKYSAKITDFGMAKVRAHAAHATKCGTPAWMAPEVLSGRYTEKADVFSFGVIMWELLACRPPYAGLNQVQIIHAVQSHRPPGHIPQNSPLYASCPGYVRLMQDCSHAVPHYRPSFRRILEVLRHR